MRGYPERTLATRAKWLLATRDDVEVSVTERVAEMEAVLKELANAPELEPVGEAVNFNGWEIVIWKGKESDFPVGTKFYAIPPGLSMPPADLVRDAERYRWLRTYNTAKHTAVTEAFFLGDESLDAGIDAAIAAKKGGA